MNWLKRTAALLRKYRRMWSVISSLAFSALCVTASFFFKESGVLLHMGSIWFMTLVLWEISEVKLLEQKDEAAEKLADKTDENILLSGKVNQLEDEVRVYKALSRGKKENPIRSNRVVSDKTFAIRLRSFVEKTNVCDAAGEEEQQYILKTAERLLNWQIKTVRRDTAEYEYLCRLNLIKDEHSEPEKEATGRIENENKN